LPAVERNEEGDHRASRVRQRAGTLPLVFSSAGLPLNSFHLLLAQKECSSNTSARKGHVRCWPPSTNWTTKSLALRASHGHEQEQWDETSEDTNISDRIAPKARLE
jgi:hypothetical protein